MSRKPIFLSCKQAFCYTIGAIIPRMSLTVWNIIRELRYGLFLRFHSLEHYKRLRVLPAVQLTIFFVPYLHFRFILWRYIGIVTSLNSLYDGQLVLVRPVSKNADHDETEG